MNTFVEAFQFDNITWSNTNLFMQFFSNGCPI